MECSDLHTVSGHLPEGSLFAKVQVEACVDSTNTRLKAMAVQGAPEGAVLLAEEQSGGRGTQGRVFHSPLGEGLYLSALLRPQVGAADLLQLTGWVAVAVRRAVERACGAPVEIKWLNDLYLNGRKVCGILTELSLKPGGQPDFVVVGIGLNVSQRAESFREQGLENIATSLAIEGYSVERSHLCVCLLEELEKMYRAFPAERQSYLEEYRSFCLTLGRLVSFEENRQTCHGIAVEVDEGFGLVIRGADGRMHSVSSGTVSLLATTDFGMLYLP